MRSPFVRIAIAGLIVVNVRDRHQDLRKRQSAWGESVRMPVMVRSRPAGSVLRSTDIAWRSVPRLVAVQGTPKANADVVGRRLVSLIDVGEFVTETRLTRGPSSALRSRIGEGRYAVAISIRENRPRVSVGDEVDVLDATGDSASTRSVVVQTDSDSITLAVRAEDLRALSAALSGPVLLAVRGEDRLN